MKVTGDSEELGPDPTSQALISLVPKVGPILATWRQETYERKQKRVEKLAAAAAEEIDVEQLFRQVATDERLTDLFNAAVDSAIATSSDAKIRLLGRVVAAGALAEDEARIDEAEQLLRIALDLDPVDLRAMRALERWRGRDAVRSIAYALDVDRSIAGPIVARLERLHLVRVERTASVYDKANPEDDQVDLDEVWEVTDTAEALLNLLRQQVGTRNPDLPRGAGAPWSGFTDDQAAALERLVDLGRHDWRQDPQPESSVAKALRKLDALGLPYDEIRNAMRSVGFDHQMLSQLDRWEASR